MDEPRVAPAETSPTTEHACALHEVSNALTVVLGWLDAGARAESLDAATAARDIPLGEFADWSDAERIVVNVDTLYREFGAQQPSGDPLRLLRGMAEWAAD